MPQITPFRTQVDVQAWTPQGQHHHLDLMGSLKQIQTSKTTNQPYGTFNLTFTSQERGHGTWADKLPYRTYVEIRAGANTVGTPPILMRGFVSTGTQSLTMPQAPNGPARQVVISGKDMGVILADWQILYLWGIDPMATYLNANTSGGDALGHALGVSVQSTNPAQLVHSFFDKLVATAINGLQHTISPAIPSMTPEITLPSAYQVNFVNLQPWQGSYANFLDYFASPPWGENFVYDAETGPQYILRQTPYKNFSTGSYPLPFGDVGNNGFFPDVTINAGDITGHALTINGAEQVYTYYLTIPDMASSQAQSNALWYYVSTGNATITKVAQPKTSTQAGGVQFTTPTQAQIPGSNPYYDAERANIWGIRPLQVTTPWISAIDQTMTPIPAQMNTWLVNVFQNNDLFSSGTISCHGHQALQIGRYVVLAPGTNTVFAQPYEAYIEQVDHLIDIYSNTATWTTNLGVVRGRVRTSG